MSITIYHNPRCSKSRKTLEIIVESGIEPTIVEYDNLPAELRNREDSFIANMARFPDQRIFLENISTGDTIFSKRVATILAELDHH